MERHNSHIILESNSSDSHSYIRDENGNIKIDTNEDDPYHSFVEKKKKLDIIDILIENNKLLREEYEKRLKSEEMLRKSSKRKKKRKVIKTDLYVKSNDYRFNINKIRPSFKEIDLKFDKEIDFSDSIEDRKNQSFDLEEKKEKKVENKFKRNTMYMPNYGTNTKKLKGHKNKANKENKEKKESKMKDKTDKKKNLPLLREMLEYSPSEIEPEKKDKKIIKNENKYINEEKKIVEEKSSEKNSESSEEKKSQMKVKKKNY